MRTLNEFASREGQQIKRKQRRANVPSEGAAQAAKEDSLRR